MGLGPRISTSSFSPTVRTQVVYKPDPRNPNPLVYTIDEWKQIGWFLVVVVVYPNCTNYEGKKILVYENVSMEQLLAQKSIDPHFSDNKNFFSPIARFEPTRRGMHMTVTMVKAMIKEG